MGTGHDLVRGASWKDSARLCQTLCFMKDFIAWELFVELLSINSQFVTDCIPLFWFAFTQCPGSRWIGAVSLVEVKVEFSWKHVEVNHREPDIVGLFLANPSHALLPLAYHVWSTALSLCSVRMSGDKWSLKLWETIKV